MSNQLISRVETITPVLAEEYLKHNTSNRQLRKNIVSYYASQMKNGQWMLNGEGIIFNEQGTLVDGQHRLAAVAESGVNVDMLVVRNADKDSFATVDCGVSRKISDTFFVRGIPNATTVSSIIGRYKKLCSNRSVMGNVAGTKSGNTASRQDLLREYASDEDFWQDIYRFSKACYDSMRLMTATEIGSIAAYLIKERKHLRERVYDFFEDLLKSDTPKSSMLALFRKRLIQDKLSNERIAPIYKQQLFTSVWNAYAQGRELKVVKWDKSRVEKKELI